MKVKVLDRQFNYGLCVVPHDFNDASENLLCRQLSPTHADPHHLFERNLGDFRKVIVLSNGNTLDWSDYRHVELWGRDDFQIASLEGHTDHIGGVTEMSDGRIISWSRDSTTRIWSQSGELLSIHNDHEGWVIGVTLLDTDRLLSWYDDGSLRFWNASNETLNCVHTNHQIILGLKILNNGNILSWSGCELSDDYTLQMWDRNGNKISESFIGHTDIVQGVMELSDGRLLSWSTDKTLRFWNNNGTPLGYPLKGHTDSILEVICLPNGQFLSWSLDNTVRLWNENGTTLTHPLIQHDDLSGVMLTQQDRILTWSFKTGTLQLWSLDGEKVRDTMNSEGNIIDVVQMSDGCILVLHEYNLRLFNRDGKPLELTSGYTGTVVIRVPCYQDCPENRFYEGYPRLFTSDDMMLV